MRVLIRGRTRWAALVSLVGALALGGLAYAVIPDSSGVIHGCYLRSGGALRVIDSSVTKCKSSETSLNWNIAGQQGPPGPPGADGAPGADATNLFALIDEEDGIQQQSGGITAGGWTSNEPFTGMKMNDVTFPQDVSTCVALATVHHKNGSFVGQFDAHPVNTTIEGAVVHVYVQNAPSNIAPDVAVAVFC